jgi:hypothetical protein
METPLSPSQAPSPAKGFTRGLINKLFDMIGYGLLELPEFQAVPTAELDKFVKAVGPKIRDEFAKLVIRLFQGWLIQAAIDANAFDNKYIYVEVSDIPATGGEEVDQIREVSFGKTMYNRDLPEAIKRRGIEDGFANGYKFASPLAVLRWAKKNPDKQRQKPRGILFYIGGRLCYLYLYGDSDRRSVHVYEFYPVGYWIAGVEFLVVPA